MVQKGQLKRQQVFAKAMSPRACRIELEAIISSAVQQVQCLKGQIIVLATMLKACAAVDDTADPPTFFNALAKSWAMVNNVPDKLVEVLQTPVASPQYANLTKKPQGWVAPSAVTGAASGTEDAVPVGPAVATAVVSMGKGGKGGKRVAKAITRTSGGKGKAVSFDEDA